MYLQTEKNGFSSITYPAFNLNVWPEIFTFIWRFFIYA